MAKKAPRTRAGGEWTEGRFWGFMRTLLRDGSRRWAPIARQALEKARRENQSGNKRLTWEYQCAECDGWFPRKEVHVDHITPCGSCRSWDEFRDFAERLFVEADELRILCHQCHQERTNGRRKSE